MARALMRRRGAVPRAVCAVLTAIVDVAVSILCRVRVEGLHHVPARGAVLMAGNHVNPLEAPVIARAAGRAFWVVISDHLRRKAVLGRTLDMLYDIVWVNRMKGRAQLVEDAGRLFAAGEMLAIMPEGRYSWNGVLGYGDRGPALIALTAGVPVLPVATVGLDRVFADLRRLRRAVVTVRFGAPIVIEGPAEPSDQDLAAATDKIMRAIAALLPGEKQGRWRNAGT